MNFGQHDAEFAARFGNETKAEHSEPTTPKKARRITFEAGEGQMELDAELAEREDLKAASADKVRTKGPKGMSLLDEIGTTFTHPEDIQKHPDFGHVLWRKALERYPERADREVLIDAIRDNILSELHRERDDLWEEEQRHHLSWQDEKKLESLGEQIDAAEKTIVFLETFELAQDEADIAKQKKEEEERARAERKFQDAERAQLLSDNFNLQRFEIPRRGQEPRRGKLPDFAAAIGQDFATDTYVLASDEQRQSIDKALATLKRQVEEYFPDSIDREILVRKLEADALRASLDFDRLRAENAMHEMTQEQIKDQDEQEQTVLKMDYIAQAMRLAFPKQG